MPTLRRKKDVASAAYKEVLAAVTGEAAAAAVVAPPPATVAPPAATVTPSLLEEDLASSGPVQASEAAGPVPALEAGPVEAVDDREAPDGGNSEENGAAKNGDGRVHRRLIRATLPRPENHSVERPIPEFTMRQANDRGGRFRSRTVRAAGSRPGGGGRGGGHSAGHGRGPAFGKPTGNRAGGHGGRAPGRPDANRPHRGGQPARHGKKHSK
jgi:hypothetical protein